MSRTFSVDDATADIGREARPVGEEIAIVGPRLPAEPLKRIGADRDGGKNRHHRDQLVPLQTRQEVMGCASFGDAGQPSHASHTANEKKTVNAR